MLGAIFGRPCSGGSGCGHIGSHAQPTGLGRWRVGAGATVGFAVTGAGAGTVVTGAGGVVVDVGTAGTSSRSRATVGAAGPAVISAGTPLAGPTTQAARTAQKLTPRTAALTLPTVPPRYLKLVRFGGA
jgi:hypothetical protein